MLNRKLESETVGDTEGDGQAIPTGRLGERFERRRADIIAAAIPVLNGQGFKGMRLTAVAELIGLKSTGITYYFPRKEELAVACLESGMSVFHDLLSIAERETDACARVARLVELFIERDAAAREGRTAPLASFSVIRALEGEHFDRALEAYKQMFRRVRALFESPELGALDKTARSIRAMILLEQLYWANTWLGDYDLDEFPRLARRMIDIVANGLAPEGAGLAPANLSLSRGAEIGDAKEAFLRAAIREINAHGYRGASVDRISARLKLTKGAFYHHNEAKDELVAACFRHSFSIIRQAQRVVRNQGLNERERLITAVTALIRFQLSPEGPLMRAAFLSSVPQEHQAEMVGLSYKASRQFASMISDGVADASIRAVDPAIAGALISAAVDVASDVRMTRMATEDRVIRDCVRPLFNGLVKP